MRLDIASALKCTDCLSQAAESWPTKSSTAQAAIIRDYNPKATKVAEPTSPSATNP